MLGSVLWMKNASGWIYDRIYTDERTAWSGVWLLVTALDSESEQALNWFAGLLRGGVVTLQADFTAKTKDRHRVPWWISRVIPEGERSCSGAVVCKNSWKESQFENPLRDVSEPVHAYRHISYHTSFSHLPPKNILRCVGIGSKSWSTGSWGHQRVGLEMLTNKTLPLSEKSTWFLVASSCVTSYFCLGRTGNSVAQFLLVFPSATTLGQGGVHSYIC